MASVEQLIFSDGERYPMLVDDEGMPHFWITLFITVNVRPNATQNTINSYISDLRHFFLWEEVMRRDVISEFQKKQYLSDIDAVALRDFCLLKTDTARKWHNRGVGNRVRRINDTFPTAPRTLSRVSGDHARTRYSRIIEYLVFLAKTLLRQRPDVEKINADVDTMENRLGKNKPEGGRRNNHFNPDDKAPPPEIFDTFLDYVQHDSPDCPYKSQKNKKRNSLIYNVMDQTGIRASELLGLRIEDVDFHENTIAIRRRHDDPVDKRRYQPVAKTCERKIPVEAELVNAIRDYIMNVRAITHGARKHPILFVTHHKGEFEGEPLSNSGFLKLLRQAVNKIAQNVDSYQKEELVNDICRHGFRHNFNYRLSRKFDEHNERAKSDKSIKPYSEKEQNQIRMYLNGWSDEKTAATYNRRFIIEAANKLMRTDMEKQSIIVKGVKNDKKR